MCTIGIVIARFRQFFNCLRGLSFTITRFIVNSAKLMSEFAATGHILYEFDKNSLKISQLNSDCLMDCGSDLALITRRVAGFLPRLVLLLSGGIWFGKILFWLM